MSENERINEGVIWSPEAVRQLQQWKRGLPGIIRQTVLQYMQGHVTFREKDVRAAITVGFNPNGGYDGQGEEDPSFYPNPPANTFWVKLCKPEYTKAAGLQDLVLTPYSPPEFRLAHHPLGEYVEEGSEVWLTLHHGQYYIMPKGGGATGQGVFIQYSDGYDGGITADILVEVAPCSNPELLGQVIQVTDHAECIFDHPEEDMAGAWIFFAKEYTDYEGCHWVTRNRCCLPADQGYF